MIWLLGVSRYDLRCLFEFDGRKAAWRVGAALLLRCGAPLLSLAGFAAGIYAGVKLELGRSIVCAAVFLAGTATAGWTSRRAPWSAMILNRLQSFGEINPNRYVAVLLQWQDVDQASVVLRRVKLIPEAVFRQPAQKWGS